MTKYLCIEGVEGIGKTTQTQKLVDHLRSLGYKVLQTKEPGTSHSPLTMELRNIMLNSKYELEMTTSARELISQAIRSIHLEKVIKPAYDKYDFIIQDRGLLSGFAYGEACGNDLHWMGGIGEHIVYQSQLSGLNLYDMVILLTGSVEAGLDKAISSKQEFEAGDAIEMKGLSFMNNVNANMVAYSSRFNTTSINVDGKNVDEVFADILNAINIRGNHGG